MKRRVFPAVAVLLATAVVSLSAHLKVDRTFPETGATITAVPDRIQVWFSQAPSVPISGLTLEGASGKVELGKVVEGKTDNKADKSLVAPLVGKLEAGKYTASWKTAGNDGHIQTGTFEFTYKPAGQQ